MRLIPAKRFFAFVLTGFGFLVPALGAQQLPASAKPADSRPQQATSADAQQQRYMLKANDVLSLTFRYTPEFNQDVTVQPDGFVQLKGLDNAVHVQELTVDEASNQITKAYSTILADPDVTTTLKFFVRPYFIVSGSVKNPGKFEYRGHCTVMEAVAMAGGFDSHTKQSQILLMRHYSKDLVQVKMVDLRQVTKGKDLNKDLEVLPEDTIFVPKNAFAKFDHFIPSNSLGAYQHY
jgi:polysaccharide biosynthesis/export protein